MQQFGLANGQSKNNENNNSTNNDNNNENDHESLAGQSSNHHYNFQQGQSLQSNQNHPNVLLHTVDSAITDASGSGGSVGSGSDDDHKPLMNNNTNTTITANTNTNINTVTFNTNTGISNTNHTNSNNNANAVATTLRSPNTSRSHGSNLKRYHSSAGESNFSQITGKPSAAALDITSSPELASTSGHPFKPTTTTATATATASARTNTARTNTATVGTHSKHSSRLNAPSPRSSMKMNQAGIIGLFMRGASGRNLDTYNSNRDLSRLSGIGSLGGSFNDPWNGDRIQERSHTYSFENSFFSQTLETHTFLNSEMMRTLNSQHANSNNNNNSNNNSNTGNSKSGKKNNKKKQKGGGLIKALSLRKNKGKNKGRNKNKNKSKSPNRRKQNKSKKKYKNKKLSKDMDSLANKDASNSGSHSIVTDLKSDESDFYKVDFTQQNSSSSILDIEESSRSRIFIMTLNDIKLIFAFTRNTLMSGMAMISSLLVTIGWFVFSTQNGLIEPCGENENIYVWAFLLLISFCGFSINIAVVYLSHSYHSHEYIRYCKICHKLCQWLFICRLQYQVVDSDIHNATEDFGDPSVKTTTVASKIGLGNSNYNGNNNISNNNIDNGKHNNNINNNNNNNHNNGNNVTVVDLNDVKLWNTDDKFGTHFGKLNDKNDKSDKSKSVEMTKSNPTTNENSPDSINRKKSGGTSSSRKGSIQNFVRKIGNLGVPDGTNSGMTTPEGSNVSSTPYFRMED